MSPSPLSQSPITSLLLQWRGGDRGVENQLAALVYPVLLDIAQAQVRRHAGVITMRPTELVNAAYERLVEQKAVDWQNREHFYGIAATIFRRVLVDAIRQRQTEKQGGGFAFVGLDHQDALAMSGDGDLVDCLALDQVLTQLGELDPDYARVVELRIFAGLSVEEVAQVCASSVATVGRQWRFARAWMAAQLGEHAKSGKA